MYCECIKLKDKTILFISTIKDFVSLFFDRLTILAGLFDCDVSNMDNINGEYCQICSFVTNVKIVVKHFIMAGYHMS